MPHLLGIDIGTSGTKTLVCDGNGNCSTSNNKASNFVTVRTVLDADLRVDTVGTTFNGWFVSPPVQATIIGADPTCAIQYNLDQVVGAVLDAAGKEAVSAR